MPLEDTKTYWWFLYHSTAMYINEPVRCGRINSILSSPLIWNETWRKVALFALAFLRWIGPILKMNFQLNCNLIFNQYPLFGQCGSFPQPLLFHLRIIKTKKGSIFHTFLIRNGPICLLFWCWFLSYCVKLENNKSQIFAAETTDKHRKFYWGKNEENWHK